LIARQFAHAVQPHQRAPMRTQKTVFVQSFGQCVQRFAQEVAALTNPKLRVIAHRFNPVNVAALIAALTKAKIIS